MFQSVGAPGRRLWTLGRDSLAPTLRRTQKSQRGGFWAKRIGTEAAPCGKTLAQRSRLTHPREQKPHPGKFTTDMQISPNLITYATIVRASTSLTLFRGRHPVGGISAARRSRTPPVRVIRVICRPNW
jgi:hypothetical protein